MVNHQSRAGQAVLFSLTLILLLGSLIGLTLQPAYAGAQSLSIAEYRSGVISATAGLPPIGALAGPSFGTSPLNTPAQGASLLTAYPTFDWDDASGSSLTYTLLITGSGSFTGLSIQAASASVTTTLSAFTPTKALPAGFYTWTVQAHDSAGDVSGFVDPYTFTVQSLRLVHLPLIVAGPAQLLCPTSSSATFDTIPFTGNPIDHPDYLHGDLNLALRGFSLTNASKTLQNYSGATDPDSPQLHALFNPPQFPGITSVYRVNQWDWGCSVHGCAGGPITAWPVTLMGMPAAPGQSIYIPERSPEIYGGGYKVLVLYAEERRITLGYTRDDSVAPGYAVHLENICVDPNLLALYKAQNNSQGWRATGRLPALKSAQALGTALSSEILVAIRDKGSFMDPRACRGWWTDYLSLC